MVFPLEKPYLRPLKNPPARRLRRRAGGFLRRLFHLQSAKLTNLKGRIQNFITFGQPIQVQLFC